MAKKCRHRSRSYPTRKNKKEGIDCAYINSRLYDPDDEPLTEGESNTFLTDDAEEEAWAKLVGRKNVKKMSRIIKGGNH